MLFDAFSGLIGQAQAVNLLTGAIAQNRIPSAYLFVGADGIGKSIAARCFVQLLFGAESQTAEGFVSLGNRIRDGNHPDLLWVQPTYLYNGKLLSSAEATAAGLKRKAPPQIRMEQIRDIGQFLSRQPLQAPRSIVVLEQSETMAESAANGLLKTLEEPGRATLILLAPSPDSLLPTLISRCQCIPFYRLNETDMISVLHKTGNLEILADKMLLAIAQGSPGDAIASWQQLSNLPEELLKNIKEIPSTPRAALELAKLIDKTLDTEAQLWLIDYLQHLYWQKQRLPKLLQLLEKARQYLLGYAQPRLVWEVTLLSMVNC